MSSIIVFVKVLFVMIISDLLSLYEDQKKIIIFVMLESREDKNNAMCC